MANSIPTLMAVNYKGSGNVQVYPLSAGTTLGAQDGNDVLAGNLEAPSATLVNTQANRLVEAFGNRYLLHGYRVYERDEGGAGNWGEVTGLGLDITGIYHSGLHLLHPGGIPTLAFLYVNASVLHAVHSTDGSNWTDTNTGVATSTVDRPGRSIVFQNSIFWLCKSSTASGHDIYSYDLFLDSATAYDLPNGGAGLTNGGSNSHCFHVHQGHLFCAGAEILGTDGSAIWRFDSGVSWTKIELGNTTALNNGSSYGMWSDGYDLIVAFQRTDGTRDLRRCINVLPSETPIISGNLGGTILVNCATTTSASYCPFLSVDPDPSLGEQRVYFWQLSGDFNSGTFNLFRFEYRQLPTGVHTGSFQVGETVSDGSGATGVVTDIVVDTSLSLTNVQGTWGAGSVTGLTSGATATSSGGLAEVAAPALGVGIAGTNYGVPQATDGGLDRIPTAGAARPEWDGQPIEIVPSARQYYFRVYGTGSTISIKLYYSLSEEAPDTEATLAAVAVVSGSPATTPSYNAGLNQIDNITPDDGATLYSLNHAATTDSIAVGQKYTVMMDIV